MAPEEIKAVLQVGITQSRAGHPAFKAPGDPQLAVWLLALLKEPRRKSWQMEDDGISVVRRPGAEQRLNSGWVQFLWGRPALEEGIEECNSGSHPTKSIGLCKYRPS